MIYDVHVKAADDSQWGEGWREFVEAGHRELAKDKAIERVRRAIQQPEADLTAEIISYADVIR
jgi:hypothetical protein